MEEEVSDTRTSQTAWFSSDDFEIAGRINRRIEAVTGLSADMNKSHSELMQIANYGMGGHYTPHYDYLIVDRPPAERHLVGEQERYAGDRTATLMFYVSGCCFQVTQLRLRDVSSLLHSLLCLKIEWGREERFLFFTFQIGYSLLGDCS